MSTDVTPYQPQQVLEPAVYNVDPTGGRLVAWASSLFAAKQIADALCQTTFAPAHFRGKPDDGAAAIMFGDEIGLSPTQALRSIYVISGTPSLYARQMVAIVMHHGHEVWTEEKSDTKVTVSGRRRGSSHVHTETWTTARAAKAGYTNNKKYTSDPQAMLYARAAADICRQVAPDALAGLAYTVEELEINDQPTTTTRRTTPTTTAKRAAPAMPEPDLEPETLTADEPIPADDPDLIDPRGKQMKALQAGMKDAGKGDRDDALAFLSAVLGRPVESSKTLTRAEAGKVLDELQFMAEGTPEEPTFDDAS